MSFSLRPLSIAMLVLGAHATLASDLIISEYVEGSSNNKAIELYNPTNNTIDLSAYQLKYYFNGNTNAGTTISLTGTVEAGKTHVIVQSQAAAELIALANQTNGSSWFNGDDAIVLLNNSTVIDSLGQIGVDPGSSWSENGVSTIDATLRRNGVLTDIDASNVFSPAQQWLAFPNNSFDDLGRFNSDDTPEQPQLGQCGENHSLPHQIQGNGVQSPVLGETAVIEAVITGDFRGSNKLRGVYVQSPNSEHDADETSSEAVFVYDPAGLISAPVGARVRLLATAGEYSGQTQLTQVQGWIDCGVGASIDAVALTLPLADDATLERYEGMLVRASESMNVSDTYNLARYGEIALAFGGPLWQPTEVVAPGIDAQKLQQQNSARRLLLDDGSSQQNPAVIAYPAPRLTYDNSLRVGDEVRPFTAVLNEAFGAYRLQPVEMPVFDKLNLRDVAPMRHLDTTVRVASFNVLNYFNGDGIGGGFPTPRGANTPEEFDRQRQKIANAITELNADIVGLMEIENDGDDTNSALQDLVNALNERATDGATWQPVQTGLLGTDQIRVALIYRADRVMPYGAPERIDTGVFATGNRVPLLQRFAQSESAQVVSVVVNHFKSKGSCPSNSSDLNADQGDGQSCWNALRTEAANALSAWLSARSQHERIVLIGDFNAYSMEDPMTVLAANGYTRLGEVDGHSYVFDGQLGSLDHGVANARLLPEVLASKHWSINADEPRALDYNMEFKTVEQQLEWYGNSAYRSSDHDPLVVDIGARTFSQSVKKPSWQVLFARGETVISYNVAAEQSVNAMTLQAQLLHSRPQLLSFALRAPDGSETPLVFAFERGSFHQLNLKQLIGDKAAKGEWKLIIRSAKPHLGLLLASELKLD